MEAAIITKTLQKVNQSSPIYTLGFNRLASLPVRVRKNISYACVQKGETNTDSVKNLFNTMSETEFINWLKLN